MRLPVPHPDGDISLELRLPDSVSMMQASQKSNSGANYQAMHHLLKKGIKHDGPSDYIVRLPLVSAEYLLLEIMKLYDVETKLQGVYRCARPGCAAAIILEQKGESDNRIDLDEQDIVFAEDEPDNPNDDDEIEQNDTEIHPYVKCHHVLEIEDRGRHVVHRRADGTELARISGWTFRHPLLEDMIKLESDRTLKDETMRACSLLLKCLVDFDAEEVDEGFYGGDKERIFKKIRNVLKFDLVRFPHMKDMNNVIDGIRRYGLDTRLSLFCTSCGGETPVRLQFTDFFESALHSLSFAI
jgi:hypothetical protein